jgi:hypothetical protein
VVNSWKMNVTQLPDDTPYYTEGSVVACTFRLVRAQLHPFRCFNINQTVFSEWMGTDNVEVMLIKVVSRSCSRYNKRRVPNARLSRNNVRPLFKPLLQTL